MSRLAGSREACARKARSSTGRLAEWRARLWFRVRGWRILAVRVRTPVGEIDFIARRGKMLAIVEVKQRRTLEEALAALSPHQRQRITRAAALWLAMKPRYSGQDVRFDLVAVDARLRLRHVPAAWRADEAVFKRA